MRVPAPGIKQNFLARAGVQVHVNERLRVDRVQLFLREFLTRAETRWPP